MTLSHVFIAVIFLVAVLVVNLFIGHDNIAFVLFAGAIVIGNCLEFVTRINTLGSRRRCFMELLAVAAIDFGGRI